MSGVPIHITDHAIDRYRERVGPLPNGALRSRLFLFSEIMSAKQKHLKRMVRKSDRRTVMVPTPRAVFIFSYGRLVTVLGREQIYDT